ncbi:SMP-30/gluconolactonase/LRE family protein [Streptomyces europaeiscabiei]|uniref:SMP-30/gluconolactonase/LRE family protein n=1 Tax=Streptomyces europaeiscabiei TaxID=146819 RepID=A0AAJ2UJ80_9ACTN|nr:SMP-30/gluconolactonase/LRE family protein [Streptomyces europaeiscabiei]MDX3128430.1 SMP-30/gluconolactonase/LRE family protein [Streptomyces europaeiscabiei]
MKPKTTVVLDGFGVLESLRWHDDALWFCDVAHGTVHRWDTIDKPETVVDVPGRAGGTGFLPDGRMLVVSSSPVVPDGIAPGKDGTTWVANAPRGECIRVGPGGTILDRVATSQRTLSCLVAGPKGDTLYAATIATDDPPRARELNASRIESYVLPS